MNGTWTGGDLDVGVFENVVESGETYLMAGRLQDVNVLGVALAEFPRND